MAPESTQPSRGNLGTIIRRVTKALGDVFVPIIPAIVASGLLMGLTEGLNNAMGGTLSTNSWWVLIHTFSNASFIFLQILIGFSAARIFGGNEFLGGVIGMIMNHTALINAWDIPAAIRTFGADAYQTVGSERAAGWLSIVTGNLLSATDASTSAIISAGGVPQVNLGLVNVTLQGYQGHVIPVVVAVFLMCRIEKWLHEHVPDMFDLFVTPLVTVLLTGLATMIFIGPFFSFVENLVLQFFRFLLAIPFGFGGALAGAIYPVTVVMGVHHMFNALEAGLCAQTPPYDNFNPIISAANVAQGAACLAVFAKTVSQKKRGIALPSGISALLGITEPAIYGVNLPVYRPFAAAMAGGAAGGAVSAIMDLHSNAYGITGVFGYLITSDVVGYSLMLAIAFLVSFAVTLLLYNDSAMPKAETAPKAADASAASEERPANKRKSAAKAASVKKPRKAAEKASEDAEEAQEHVDQAEQQAETGAQDTPAEAAAEEQETAVAPEAPSTEDVVEEAVRSALAPVDRKTREERRKRASRPRGKGRQRGGRSEGRSQRQGVRGGKAKRNSSRNRN